MKKENTIQDKMFAEMQDKKLFDQVRNYANTYLNTAFDRHVYPLAEAHENLKHFQEDMPEASMEGHDVLALLQKHGSPATIPSIGGRYYGFVTGSSVPTGMAARQLADTWDQVSAMYVISPISATLESVVEKWLKQLFELPDSTVAGFVSGSSLATFCGLAAARYRLLKNLGWDLNQDGLFGAPKLRVITSKHTHSTVVKAVSLLGFGQNAIEWVDVDDQGRIIPEAMPELDERCLIILQAGNVNSGSFDPLEAICDKANAVKAWVHIDGAFGLWAAAIPELKHLTKGMQKAHSWSVDSHKTLNTPYDGGIILCKDKDALVNALQMKGAYIVWSEKRDGMLYTPEMSRRARGIEIWATMKYLGKSGISQMVIGLHERAVQFAEAIQKVGGFEVLNEVVFNQVMVVCKTDELTESTLHQIQELRTCWVGGSSWNGQKVIRVSVCSWATTAEDIELSVASFAKALNTIQKINSPF